ncbi:MAG: hypothetical protein ABF673_01015 [Acetobacter persici]
MNMIAAEITASDDGKTGSFSISVKDDASEKPVAYGTFDIATGRVLGLIIGFEDEEA